MENLAKLKSDLGALYRRAKARTDQRDIEQLRKIEAVGIFFFVFGLIFAPLGINPVAPIAFSLAILTRWGVAHHVLHGAYDRIPGVPRRYRSVCFAKGWRRWIDWPDWMTPKGWCKEHNFFHHRYTGEELDPDIPERNAKLLRELRLPKVVKIVIVFLVAATWKFTYYAAATTNKSGIVGDDISLTNFWDLRLPAVRFLWANCLIPYILFHFVLLPLCFVGLGKAAVLSVFWNRLIAEVLTNVHSFFIVVTNHAGDDVYRFSGDHKRLSFEEKQIMGSVNFTCRPGINDYLHMYLNYQIEHHLFPDLTIRQLAWIQPKVKEVAEVHGVSYVQESVFLRSLKLLRNLVGVTSMKKAYDGTLSAEPVLRAE